MHIRSEGSATMFSTRLIEEILSCRNESEASLITQLERAYSLEQGHSAVERVDGCHW